MEKRAKRRGHLRSVYAAIARGATRGGCERERERGRGEGRETQKITPTEEEARYLARVRAKNGTVSRVYGNCV